MCKALYSLAHLFNHICNELNAYVPQNYVKVLIPDVMLLGGGALG